MRESRAPLEELLTEKFLPKDLNEANPLQDERGVESMVGVIDNRKEVRSGRGGAPSRSRADDDK